MPLILNSSHILKRNKENDFLKLIVENVEKTNGVAKVQVIPGGIAVRSDSKFYD